MRIKPCLLFTGLILPLALHAAPTQYVRLSGGVAFVKPGQNQTVHFSPTYWKTDVSSDNLDHQGYGGLAAGYRLPVAGRFEAEIGAGFYYATSFTQNGQVYQYSSPRFNNLNYAYQIQHARLMLEGKLLTTYANKYHPYFAIGAGIGRNRSFDYQETPTQSFAVADPAFRSNTVTSFAYAAGIGVDVDVAPRWRIGGGYEFTHLGTAALNPSPAQQNNERVSAGGINASELMLQVTYAV